MDDPYDTLPRVKPSSHRDGDLFYFNFHGIGAIRRSFEYNEEPYWLPHERFLEIVRLVERSPYRDRIVFTFDDSNESDFDLALQPMLAANIYGMFFVLANKIGQPGYLDPDQIRRLRAHGMAIGSHGCDHVRWDLIDEGQLQHEVAGSLQIISKILGEPVGDIGLPFGNYNARVLRCLRANGVERCYSSDGGLRVSSRSPIPRFSVRKEMSDDLLTSKLEKGFDLKRRLFNEAKILMKGVR
jgi:peptidoglycan/xylan/chitin deacetylase (PgdA/CDA1 family)